VSATVDEVPADLWNEDGDRVWIRGDLYLTAGGARYGAWLGRNLPIGFREMGVDLLDLRVRVAYLKFEPDPDALLDEWPWKPSDRSDPDAVRFWEIR
jgi:hypothetical protein